ncbi:uncharacterized protein LOC126736080 isoform X1 [Anthonomus grandis grandis]|uniref:uncharacterized protein LOC126736080 isoform X1 n=1 Tax=Anthonomus grandis grandis TaxID=2921223 RepID=UPI0021665C53|nr:uncharacterized protein LOC126736080 isoform X1 [Anthonomus grandis grandis]
MSGDIRQFLEEHRLEILRERERLNLLTKFFQEENKENVQNQGKIDDLQENKRPSDKGDFDRKENQEQDDSAKSAAFLHDTKENCVGAKEEGSAKGICEEKKPSCEKVPSIVEPLDLRDCYELSLEQKKQALIEKLANSESFFTSKPNETRVAGSVGQRALFGLPHLRRGDFAPQQCYTTLRAAPHEGLGEYDIKRPVIHRSTSGTSEGSIRQKDQKAVPIPEILIETPESSEIPLEKSSRSTYSAISVDTKSVQTDIQNINTELVIKNEVVQSSALRTVTDDLVDLALQTRSPLRRHVLDQRLTTEENAVLLRAASARNPSITMDKPKSILSNRRTGSARDRYNSDLGQTSYASTTFMDGFSYSDRSDDLERERLKRESYQHELRLQIEEKRHLTALREDQERRERELENRRLEQQLLRMREEQAQEDQRRQRRTELMRRHSDDLLRRKTELHEMNRPWRRHADSESANLDTLGLGTSPTGYTCGAGSSGYSPPVSRRAPVSPYSSSATSYNMPPSNVFPDSSSFNRYNTSRFESSSYPGGILRKPSEFRRMESVNSYDTMPLARNPTARSRFDRFDSLSRIDSLSHRLETMSMRDGYSSTGGELTDLHRRHSATQQDLSLNRSPRLRRRNSSSRFEDPLPVPMLKARSPVAKELRNAIPFSSHRETQRRIDDRWQSQKLDSPGVTGSNATRGSILTQLGSIRAQLQREQLRMDESLRRRGLMRTRTTDQDY